MGKTNRHISRNVGVVSDDWHVLYVYRGNETFGRLLKGWTAQRRQDKSIVEVFKGKKNGFFLDIAANDAIHLSNTLALEQLYNWTGICVEPNPKYIPDYLFRRCRIVQAAVGPIDNQIIEFALRGAGGGIVGDMFDNKRRNESEIVSLRTVSIVKVLQDLGAPRLIDYFSCDIEGAEEWALLYFPWNKYTFLTLTVERPTHKLRSLLKKNGYMYLCDHGSFGDQFWLHSTFPDAERVKQIFAPGYSTDFHDAVFPYKKSALEPRYCPNL